MTSQEYLFDLHADHIEWSKALDFYIDDLRILQNRLSEVSIKNTGSSVKMEVEKFQNQFVIQKNEIEILKHKIGLTEDQVENNVLANPIASDHRKMDQNKALIGRMHTFQKLFAEMKAEFNDFIGKHL